MENQEIRLERLRSPEVAQLIGQGWSRVVFSCGAVEQHGPHMPLFMDAEHGTFLAREVATRLGNTLVAPTIRIGCSDHHMAFAGTITLRKDTFHALVTDYVTSLAHHGFRSIMILPTHGGNYGPLAEIVPDLRSLLPDITILAYTDLVGLVRTWRDGVQRVCGQGNRVGGHADIAETSLMLHMHPELVRMDLAEPGFSMEIKQEVIDRIIREGFDKVTPNGIMGDARGASAPLGRSLLVDLAEEIVARFASSLRQ